MYSEQGPYAEVKRRKDVSKIVAFGAALVARAITEDDFVANHLADNVITTAIAITGVRAAPSIYRAILRTRHWQEQAAELPASTQENN